MASDDAQAPFNHSDSPTHLPSRNVLLAWSLRAGFSCGLFVGFFCVYAPRRLSMDPGTSCPGGVMVLNAVLSVHAQQHLSPSGARCCFFGACCPSRHSRLYLELPSSEYCAPRTLHTRMHARYHHRPRLAALCVDRVGMPACKVCTTTGGSGPSMMGYSRPCAPPQH